MQQPILNSPQDLVSKRGGNTSFLLESFIPSLKAVVKAPLHCVPIQPAVCLVPICQEGLICTLNLEFAARKSIISTDSSGQKSWGSLPLSTAVPLGRKLHQGAASAPSCTSLPSSFIPLQRVCPAPNPSLESIRLS